MKKLLLVIIVSMGFMSCMIYDYGCATVELVEMIGEGTAETYIEATTGEDYDEDSLVGTDETTTTEE